MAAEVLVIMEAVALVTVQMEAHQAAEGLAALSMIIQRQAQAVTAETAQLESIAGR